MTAAFLQDEDTDEAVDTTIRFLDRFATSGTPGFYVYEDEGCVGGPFERHEDAVAWATKEGFRVAPHEPEPTVVTEPSSSGADTEF